MELFGLALILALPVAASVAVILRGRRSGSRWMRAGGVLVAPVLGFVLAIAGLAVVNASIVRAGDRVCGALGAMELFFVLGIAVVELVLGIVVWLLLPAHAASSAEA